MEIVENIEADHLTLDVRNVQISTDPGTKFQHDMHMTQFVSFQ